MSAKRFRKKPVVIDAIEVRLACVYAVADWQALPDWLIDAYEAGGVVFTPEGVHVSTLEGTMIGHLDDWLIRGVQGELYPCKPDIFEATYEAVEE